MSTMKALTPSNGRRDSYNHNRGSKPMPPASTVASTITASTAVSTPPKFVMSRPIGAIMRDPLQLKVLVPRTGRSIEHQLSRALRKQQHQQGLCQHQQCQQLPPSQAQPGGSAVSPAHHDAIHVSIQSQHEADCLNGHTHFDLVMRLLQRRLRAAHLLCKVMYRNVRDEVKEMGPYLLRVTEPICCYRLEEMNCQVSPKTNHYHVYLALQLVSAEPQPQPPVLTCLSCGRTEGSSGQPQPDESGDGEAGDFGDVDDLASLLSATPPRSTRSRHQSISSSASVSLEEPPMALSPTGAQLPDFSVRWSPLATLTISADGADTEGPLYYVPQLLCLCSEMFADLLMVQRPGNSREAGELVLSGVARSDLLLLLQLVYPGTPATVTLANVQQVLRLAAKFRVPHLRATADQLLCRSVHAFAPISLSRRHELCSLATQFSLPCLAELLRLRLTDSE